MADELEKSKPPAVPAPGMETTVEEPSGASAFGGPAKRKKREETQVATATKEEDQKVEYVPPSAKTDDAEPKKTWSSYGNQEAASVGAALADAEANRKLQESTNAPFYSFQGHRDRHNATDLLKTRYGAVKKGGNIKLPDDELSRLRSLGFVFTRVK